MLTGERQAIIAARLAEDGRVVAQTLAAELDVSEDTIRRDLRELAKAGVLRRVYGGALPIAPDPGAVTERIVSQPASKAALARAALPLFEPNQVVFLDAGSTSLALAAILPDDLGLTVITHMPRIVVALEDRPGINVIQIGGVFDRHSGACLGAQAIDEAARFHADLCFLGACGIDASAGVTTFGFEDAAFKRAIAAASRRVAVAVTTEKLGTAAPFSVIDTDAVDVLIVEADAPYETLRSLARSSMSILQAPAWARKTA